MAPRFSATTRPACAERTPGAGACARRSGRGRARRALRRDVCAGAPTLGLIDVDQFERGDPDRRGHWGGAGGPARQAPAVRWRGCALDRAIARTHRARRDRRRGTTRCRNRTRVPAIRAGAGLVLGFPTGCWQLRKKSSQSWRLIAPAHKSGSTKSRDALRRPASARPRHGRRRLCRQAPRSKGRSFPRSLRRRAPA